MLESIQSTTQYIKNRIGDFVPEVGIILGTGLGGLVKEIEVEKQLLYANIPNFPISTLEFHSGKLIFGKLSGHAGAPALLRRVQYAANYLPRTGDENAGHKNPAGIKRQRIAE
jgi:purine-nucleoside phosphorylase